jgi:hypothetical protein
MSAQSRDKVQARWRFSEEQTAGAGAVGKTRQGPICGFDRFHPPRCVNRA